jgi:ribonuclease Z
MRIVILGSGGAFPTPKRMLPSVVLLREGEMFMFDCGEGTQLQLGKSHLGWARLKAILITHLHGDHIIGLSGLMMTMSMGSREAPLTIYGPPGIKDFVYFTQKYLKFGVAYPLEVAELKGGVVRDEEQYLLEAMPVQHRVFTLAYRLVEKPRPGRFDLDKARELGIPPGPDYKRLQSGKEIKLDSGRVVKPEEVLGPPRAGRKFVYMVDTRPFPGAVEFARGADLLVYDGMFDEELAAEAKDRGHSTTSEAAALARKAGVEKLVLCHISPRYQVIKTLLYEAREVFPNTRIARDLDVFEIPLKDI